MAKNEPCICYFGDWNAACQIHLSPGQLMAELDRLEREDKSGQKKSHSFAESIINVVVGFAINLAANLIVFPWFGIKITVAKSIGIGLVFTVISVVRSYCLRRWFNRMMVKERV